MREQSEQIIRCPYCDESVGILVDHSVPLQNYIEDCQVCCRPINFRVAVDLDGNVEVLATSDNE